MSRFAELPSEQQKEAILQRSPFLRTFLDQTAQKLNYPRWQTELLIAQDTLCTELDSQVGKNWPLLVVQTHTLSSSLQGVFQPKLPMELRMGFVMTLILIGYEIGDCNDVDLFLTEVTKRAGPRGISIINPRAFIEREKCLSMVDTISGLLKAGAYIKEYGSTVTDTEKGRNEPSNPFKSFIDGLDLSGI